jgi:hypothetical protein
MTKFHKGDFVRVHAKKFDGERDEELMHPNPNPYPKITLTLALTLTLTLTLNPTLTLTVLKSLS